MCIYNFARKEEHFRRNIFSREPIFADREKKDNKKLESTEISCHTVAKVNNGLDNNMKNNFMITRSYLHIPE